MPLHLKRVTRTKVLMRDEDLEVPRQNTMIVGALVKKDNRNFLYMVASPSTGATAGSFLFSSLS